MMCQLLVQFKAMNYYGPNITFNCVAGPIMARQIDSQYLANTITNALLYPGHPYWSVSISVQVNSCLLLHEP